MIVSDDLKQHIENSELIRFDGLIDGDWIESEERFDVLNPFNQNCLAKVANLNHKHARQAIQSADTAWQQWRFSSVSERRELLRRWLDLIKANQLSLAKIITLEQGKPLKESKGEVMYAASYISYYLKLSEQINIEEESSIPSNGMKIRYEAVGVCGIITPWNFPLAMIVRKMAPAILAGCSVVIKPSEFTPLSALTMGYLLQQAGAINGLVNVIPCSNAKPIGTEFSENPLVRKMSFTGSTRVGQWLMEHGSSTLKRLSLELGGNAPFVICEDADISKVIQGLKVAKFRNGGQTCIAANRIFVHQSLHDSFCEKVKQLCSELQLGNGLDNESDTGPLIHSSAVVKVKELIEDARVNGGEIVQTHQVDTPFVSPTIITNVNNRMKLYSTEIFGPVIAIYSYSDEQELIKACNNTIHGLAAYVFSENEDRANRISSQLEFGMIGINTGSISSAEAPFGGVKQSGVGREGGLPGLRAFQTTKYLRFLG